MLTAELETKTQRALWIISKMPSMRKVVGVARNRGRWLRDEMVG